MPPEPDLRPMLPGADGPFLTLGVSCFGQFSLAMATRLTIRAESALLQFRLRQSGNRHAYRPRKLLGIGLFELVDCQAR